jgi:hypothetical protein
MDFRGNSLKSPRLPETILSIYFNLTSEEVCYIYDKNRYLSFMDEIITVEPYEWVIYIYSGLALTAVGFILLILLVLREASEADEVVPGMIAAMVCFITSLYFFSEGHTIKQEQKLSTDIDIRSDK